MSDASALIRDEAMAWVRTAKANYNSSLFKKSWLTNDMREMSIVLRITLYAYALVAVTLLIYGTSGDEYSVHVYIALGMMSLLFVVVMIGDTLDRKHRTQLRETAIAYTQAVVDSQIPHYTEDIEYHHFSQDDQVHFVFSGVSVVFFPRQDTFAVAGISQALLGEHTRLESLFYAATYLFEVKASEIALLS